MSASPTRVLLVEDNADVRLTMKRALEMAGFSAATAANGAEAVIIQSRRPADILVTDISMLERDGFETIEGFRTAYPRTKIVAVAGDARWANKDYHRLAGALVAVDATVRKPIDPKELIRTLRSLGAGPPRPAQPGENEDRAMSTRFPDLNALVQQVADAAKEIERRKKAEAELRDADRRKDEFLAMLAHELRSPLAPINNALEIMKRIEIAEPRLRWSRDVILRQMDHVTRLVDDLLDISRIARGRMTLHRQQIRLADVLERAIEASRPSIEDKKHHLVVADEPVPIYVEGDAVRLGQVISNLLNNAVKYTPEGGEIRLSAEADGGDAVLKISDNGFGIPPEVLPHVFDVFSEVAQAHANQQGGGLGIGLMLSRRLVELHGGTIEARSAGPGKGSEFIVRLPRVG